MEGDEGLIREYYITTPAEDGALYFTAESYYQDLVPNECTQGTYLGYALSTPVIDIELWEDGGATYTAYKLYADQFPYPILITSYDAGTVWTVKITWTWFDSAAPDYTLKVYSKQDLEILDEEQATSQINYNGDCPSGFTNSDYRSGEGEDDRRGADCEKWESADEPPRGWGDIFERARGEYETLNPGAYI